MRRLPERLQTGLLALLAMLLASPWVAMAEPRTMRFRPVPAESVAAIDARDRAVAAADSAAAVGAVVVDAPDTPDTPEPPDEPRTRSTSGDVVRFGSDVTVERDQVVDGDVVSFGGDVEVKGQVKGNVSAMGGDLTLVEGARVDGDVVCIGGTLREETGSTVGGQRVTAPRTPGAKIFFPMLAVVGTGFQMVAHAMGLLLMLAIAWLIVKLAPGRTQHAIDFIHRDPGSSFVVGLLMWALLIPSVIALALVVALLCITIIGIPLAAAVGLAYCAFFVVAAMWGTVVGYGILGHRLYPKFRTGEATLMQAVLWGGIALHGLRIASDLFHVVPVFGFVGGILTAFHFIGLWVLGTIGAGALVRGEYDRRSLQTWWGRMRPGSGGGAPPDMPPSGPVPPPAGPSSAEVIS
ncbi:MAG: polymer-forming cytoskeletal protein [Candidatus Eisenbacteria bacterium]|nr:polymer-forming cytoskeletal protein [Candidatus Eisenbacteria bacterium]